MEVEEKGKEVVLLVRLENEEKGKPKRKSRLGLRGD